MCYIISLLSQWYCNIFTGLLTLGLGNNRIHVMKVHDPETKKRWLYCSKVTEKRCVIILQIHLVKKKKKG